MFQGAARRGAGALLKGLKLFGYNLTLLAGGPNDLQRLALETIPSSIPAVETKFNLDIEAIPQAMCPECSYVYSPSYPNGLLKPVWPTKCGYRVTKLSEPCGESLLRSDGQPRKTLEYYPFPDWFGRFLSLPGIEQYGDRFSSDIAQQYGLPPSTKRDVRDGSFFHTFTAKDGQLFIANRGEEGRWFFLLHADFFNVEGNRLRGKTSSTGIVTLGCLNLPLHMRNDSAYRYIPFLIPGPYEPDSKVAAHQHILYPVLSDIVTGYERGFRPYGTHQSQQANSAQPYNRVHRTAIAMASMDSKAARPFAGFLDVTSHHHCFICRCFHKFHMGRTDFENWVPADDDFLRRGAELWRDAKDDKERERIVEFYGTRYSIFWMQGNWKPSQQLLVEPMHIIFLVILQRFFREALGLDNPDAKDKKKSKREGKDKGKGKGKRNENATDEESGDEMEVVDAVPVSDEKAGSSFISFYHDFEFPPHPSYLTPFHSPEKPTGRFGSWLEQLLEPEAEDHSLDTITWKNLSPDQEQARMSRANALQAELAQDHKAFHQIQALHQHLSRAAPTSIPEMEALRKHISRRKWTALAYICNDLNVFPARTKESLMSLSVLPKKSSQLTIKTMANALADWVCGCICSKKIRSH